MNDTVMTAVRNLITATQQAREVAGVLNVHSDSVFVWSRRMLDVAPAEDWQFLKHDGGDYSPVWATVEIDGILFKTCLEEDEAIRLEIMTPLPPGEPELPEPTLEELVIG